MDQVDFFDSIAKEWDNIIEVNDRKINLLLSKINIKDNHKILDVGTGTGVLMPFLEKLNPNGTIKGIDISSQMIIIAKKKFSDISNISFDVVDVENSEINDNFDKIILYSMFPHLKNKTSTIKKLVLNNLKKDGQLIIAHSNSREFLNNMHGNKDDSVKNDRLISIKDQKKIFENVGLNVVDAFENNEIYYLVINKNL